MNKIVKHKINLYSPSILLIFLFILFTAFSGFMALNLNAGIIPDEPAHYTFSKAFSTTPGIPPDTFETYTWGWYIKGNPFLYYWINGRIINLITLISTNISDQELLISLRIVNVLYSLGTIWFCYLLSKEVIRHRWWQLLPVFLLTNTLMFVFLSAGVQYDNLANLLSMAGLYFLIRVIQKHNFLVNSLAWLIFITSATLVKYPILPLALGMFIAWLIFMIVHRSEIFPLKFNKVVTITFLVILIPLIFGNFAIYGMNLIRYQSLTQPCREILSESQCELSPYERRQNELALSPKLTIEESIKQGYPSPLRYTFVDWVYHMLMRAFGMVGHVSYFPFEIISFYQALFYIAIILGLINIFIWQTFSGVDYYLLGITFFYALVLFITNYNSELAYGFKQIAVQGRYLFPVIGPLFIILTQSMKGTPIKIIKWAFVVFVLGLFLFGGQLAILLNYDTILVDWFM